MRITEYMPRALNRLYYLGVIVCFALVALTIASFCYQLEEQIEIRKEYMVYEQQVNTYKELIQTADSYYEENDYKSAESYYLGATNMSPVDAHAYIRLALIYEYYKEYELAMEVLQKYSEDVENVDITEAKNTLQTKIEQLEQSIFQLEG